MPNNKTLQGKLQSEMDHMKDARNSSSGFKQTVSSGTQGVGDSLKNKR